MSMPERSERRSTIVATAALSDVDRAQMLALMHQHYRDVQREAFERDLFEKDEALLLRREGRVVGFTTLLAVETHVHDVPVTAFFSGDTVVEKSVRGDAELLRTWGGTVFARAQRLRERHGERRVYWLLISAGYATYRFLPLFFREYIPALGREAPAFESAVLETLARARYGARFDPERGLVELEHATPLRAGVADADRRAGDPHVDYFVQRNPEHTRGVELVCLAEIDDRNLTRVGRRALGHREARSAPAHAGRDG